LVQWSRQKKSAPSSRVRARSARASCVACTRSRERYARRRRSAYTTQRAACPVMVRHVFADSAGGRHVLGREWGENQPTVGNGTQVCLSNQLLRGCVCGVWCGVCVCGASGGVCVCVPWGVCNRQCGCTVRDRWAVLKGCLRRHRVQSTSWQVVVVRPGVMRKAWHPG